MSFTFTKNRVSGLGFGLVAKIKGDLKASGKDATGETIRSIRAETVVQPSLISLIFKAAKQWLFIDKGRKPGSKLPPEKPILRWLRARGLDTKLQFIVRRSIAEKGIKPTNIFTNATKEFTKKFFLQTQDALEKDLTSNIKESFNLK